MSFDLETSKLIGRWELESESNFQEFLYELGVSYLMRKGALLPMTYYSLIAYEGNDVFSFRVRSTYKNSDTEFKVGEEFNEITADGRSVKSTYRFEGSNKLVNEQKNIKTDKIECTCTREIDNDTGKLIETLTSGNVTAVRIFSKVI